MAALRALGQRRRVRKGTGLFHEGDRSDRVLVVVSGRVKVSNLRPDGGEDVVAIVGPGELLGELAAIDGEPHSCSATAVEAVEVISIPAEAFNAFAAERPDVALGLLRAVTRRLRDADRKRVEFGTHDTLGRVARRLVELADRYGENDRDGVRITLPLSQEELAGWTGSSREAVVKALRTMRARGWIRTARREIRILDRDALEHRAR